MATFESAFKTKLIYVFRINDEDHKGILKVGEATVKEEVTDFAQLQPKSNILNKAANERIKQYTQTAGIRYELLYTEATFYLKNGMMHAFNDGAVHNILIRSGVKRKNFGGEINADEWFVTDLETVKAAIKVAKEGRQSLTSLEISTGRSPIVLRREQREAVDAAKKRFKTNNQFLWNAKMRFGKTLCGLQLVKEMKYDRTLILTHRPVVDDGWYEDFNKIFYDNKDYRYGSKQKGDNFDSLERQHNQGKHYVCFASMQDMRGSERVGGNFDKNEEMFSIEWDLVIIDEAHEGTKTELGQAVIKEVWKEGSKTKLLQLSGTPFNLIDDMKEEDIYTWDYVMEQRAKAEWDETHPGDPNPYECLPKLNIYTYDLSLELKKYQDGEHAFNFAEFFKVNVDGTFKHDKDIDNFLNLLTTDSAKNYPYSTKEWRENFRHSLWTVPSVAAAAELSKKLRQHRVLGQYQIVNVAGEGDSDADYESDNALEMVREAIGDKPWETMTITLSRGRLTTGVSVPAWTAVFMLHGSHNTSASSYMQTIFRAQTPAVINGMQKTECFVFDFAPDRTLRVLAETAKVSSKAGKTTDRDKQILGEFLNFCPVISFHGSEMSPIDVPSMMAQLKKVYIQRVVENGFEDSYLYNDKLMKLSQVELEKFSGLREKIGQTKAIKKSNEVKINDKGFTDEQLEELERIEKKKRQKQPLTAEEEELRRRRKEQMEQRNAAISILRGISIRMPMMLYGAELENEDEEITIENFANIVDAQSWEEFMPRGVTKDLFAEFIPYYDEDIFREAGRRIRNIAREADGMDVEQRIEQIATIFGTFRNPDKETVLTPWRVVNMQLGDTLGGWSFYDTEYRETLNGMPRQIDNGEVTRDVFGADAKILEINSKSGLYPLYMAYGIYREMIEAERMQHLIAEADEAERLKYHKKTWNEVLKRNIFVICKTPMAKSVTKRTLAGFTGAKVNAHCYDDLINQLKNNSNTFIKRVKDGKNFWKANSETDMKFNVIVGNPPYQLKQENTSDAPVYHLFMDVSYKTSDKVSLITPARFLFNAGKTPKEWNHKILNDKHFKVIRYMPQSTDAFPNVDIKGGVCISYHDNNKDFGKIGTYTAYPALNSILNKVLKLDFSTFSELIYAPESYKLSDKLHKEHPEVINKLSDGHRYDVTTNIFEKLPEIFTDEKPDNNKAYVKFVGLIKNKRFLKYIRKDYINSHENLEHYKVILPKSNGSGALGEVLSTPMIGEPMIGEPMIGHTQSFISIGKFETFDEANATYKYIKTKFTRCMLGVLKITQDNKRATWTNVPLQDFTSNSDIDWSKSVAEIDKQLYKKYGLTKEEIGFIEGMIKKME